MGNNEDTQNELAEYADALDRQNCQGEQSADCDGLNTGPCVHKLEADLLPLAWDAVRDCCSCFAWYDTKGNPDYARTMNELCGKHGKYQKYFEKALQERQ